MNAHEWLDANASRLVDYLVELIRCAPEYIGDGAGIRRVQELVAREIIALDPESVERYYVTAEVERHPLYVDALEFGQVGASYSPDRDESRFYRWGVNPDGTGLRLALAGHVDVEPILGVEWADSKLASGMQVGSRVYGRGSADMLGGIACLVFSLAAVHAERSFLRNVEFHCVSHEELGGNGTLSLLLGGESAAEYVIVAEPSGLERCTLSLGFEHFRCRISGRKGHAGGGLRSDRTSIELCSSLVLALEASQRELLEIIRSAAGFGGIEITPVHVGVVCGGEDPAVAPSECLLEGVVFTAPGVEEVVRDAICEIVASVSRKAVVEFSAMSFAGTGPNSSLASVAASDGQLFASPCDLRLYRAFGIAGEVWGPGHLSEAHGPDEYVSVSELLAYCHRLVNVILDIQE